MTKDPKTPKTRDDSDNEEPAYCTMCGDPLTGSDVFCAGCGHPAHGHDGEATEEQGASS